ncbi:hypothetical protein ACQZ48_22415 [Agrobacterium sp. 22-209-1]
MSVAICPPTSRRSASIFWGQRREAASDRGFGKRHRDQEIEQQVKVTVLAVRRLFGRHEAVPQVSVNIDFNGSPASAVTDTDSARPLKLALREFL